MNSRRFILCGLLLGCAAREAAAETQQVWHVVARGTGEQTPGAVAARRGVVSGLKLRTNVAAVGQMGGTVEGGA